MQVRAFVVAGMDASIAIPALGIDLSLSEIFVGFDTGP
jgi:hypothetical protein